MNDQPARGRPTKSNATLSREEVLAKALELLDTKGERDLTMRALAKALSVTPMALYHHVGNRDDLIAALIEQAFGPIIAGSTEALSPAEQIEALLCAYCDRTREHPELVLVVFSNPNAYGAPLSSITETLRMNLNGMGLAASDTERWLGILVDYTHGFALSLAAEDRPQSHERRFGEFQENLHLFISLATSEASRADSSLRAGHAQ